MELGWMEHEDTIRELMIEESGLLRTEDDWQRVRVVEVLATHFHKRELERSLR